MLPVRQVAVLGAALYLLAAMPGSFAHMDAVRVSLSQLFLTADLVAIARIESVGERTFADAEVATRHEVVTARVLNQYKGEPLSRIEFFQDAHGHAHYQAGDTAAVFLQPLTRKHPLYPIGKMGGVHLISQQVRNTEHLISPLDVEDYEWVLAAYAEPSTAATSGVEQQSDKIKQIILRMMASSSRDMMESALLDWENTGQGFQVDEADVTHLLALTRDPERPISLRMALLRAMSRRNLASEDAWTYLFLHEEKDNLLQVLRSTQGYESRDFMGSIVTMLDHPSGDLAEGAARALGHPIYSGAEPSLKPLLDSDNLRLNYAAVSALLGINSEQARLLLEEAAASHPNAKVRRMIFARINVVS